MLSKRVVVRRGSRFLLQMFLFLSAALGCVFLSGFAARADASYSMSDFQGTWYSQELLSGAGAGWIYGTIAIDSAGNATGTETNNANASVAYSSKLQVDANGIVTVAGDSSAHGYMSSNKNIIVMNFSNSGNYHLQVLVKGGGSYTASDIAAVWNCATLKTGTLTGWSSSAITLNTSGNPILQGTGGDGGGTDYLYAWQVDSSGIVTAPNDNGTAHGAMSSDKNFIVSVFTDNGNYLLQVFVRGGGSFSPSDLLATWNRRDLATGTNLGLSYGMEGIAAANATVGLVTRIETDVNGITLSDQYGAQINSNGTITAFNNDLAQGAMSSDKNIMIWAYTTEGTKGTAYGLGVDMKAPASACSYALSPLGKFFGSYPDIGAVNVVAVSSGCGWTASSNTPALLSVTSGSSGTGSGPVNYFVAGNATASAETGTLAIAGQTFTVTQLPATFTVQDFGDVDTSNFFFSYIEAIYNAHITVGCGATNGVLNYCNLNNVTREQMAAFIVRSLYGENFTYTQTPYFSDVPTTSVFFAYIQKLRELGITTGTSPTTYSPSDPVTRQQMAAFLVRAVYTDSFTYPQAPYFTDVPPDVPPGTDFFFPYIQKLRQSGITTGTSPTTYSPTDLVTRQQMAAFISRAFLGIP